MIKKDEKENKIMESASKDGGFVTHPSLIQAVVRGDEPSYERFYRIYKPLIVMRGSKCGLNTDEIATLVQDVMSAFFDRANRFTYDPGKKFHNYFYGIIKNHIFDLWKRKMRAQKVFADDPVPDDTPDSRPWPGGGGAAGSEEDEWTAYLYEKSNEEIKDRVPPVTYQVFQLLLSRKYEPREIAARLDISLSSFYNHKKTAMTEYKKILGEIKAAE